MARTYQQALQMAQQAGVSPDQMAYLLQCYAQAEQTPALPTAYPQAPAAWPQPAPSQSSVSEERIGQMLDERLASLTDRIQSTFDSRLQNWDRTKQAEWQQANAVRDAQEAETKFVSSLVEGLGFKLAEEDGNPNFLGVAVKREFDNALNDVLRETEPAELRQALDAEIARGVHEGPAFKALSHYYQTPSSDAMSKAAEACQRWKNLKWQIVADNAARQAAIPATPGAGPSAGPPPVPPSEMTEADHEAAAAAYVPGSATREEEGAGWPGTH